ncbi:hypothetical protein ACEWY4_020260 [Coilia grayii]|uniref:Vitamin K-dependent protein C n=1 Tax=Coilia grayii TaxID=363190 RepID=A0ABD1JC39_9TELE
MGLPGMSLHWDYAIRLLCVMCCMSVILSTCEKVSPSPAVLHGEVKSPQYPQPYPADVYEQWNLTVPSGYRILLSFTHLDIQPSEDCSRDSLTVTFEQETLRTFCGHLPGNYSILSPSNHLHVVFRTSKRNTGSPKGFSAFYKPVSTNCPDPGPLLNGQSKLTFDTERGVVEYSCHKPYTLRHGTPTVLYTCSEDGRWRDHANLVTPPECVVECGRPAVSVLRLQRIFRGEKAPAGSVPWQVYLVTFAPAGAFVIRDRWLLTAAHNVIWALGIVETKTIKVYVGDNNIPKMLKRPHLEVQSVRVHPSYDNPDEFSNYEHDIALIQLKRKLTFSANVMPLCLPSSDDQYTIGKTGMVSGFGYTENYTLLSDLRFVQLPLVEQKTCEDFVREASVTRGNLKYTDNMFCAGFATGGEDSCTGDSGGAFAFEQDGRFWAGGMVSWGLDCGKPGYYGVYTRISKYTDWINRIMDNRYTDCEEPKSLLNGGVKFFSITKKQYLSVIEYHCNGPYYTFQGMDKVRYTCAADGVWRDRNHSDIIPPCVPVCGRPPSVNNSSIPWQISLSAAGVERPGTIIGDRWMLTAATNLMPKGAAISKEQVKLYIKNSTFEAASLHIHPSYSKSNNRTDFSHNIALVKLKSPITFGAAAMPLCLPLAGSYEARQHGLTSTSQSRSSNLQGVWLPLVDTVRCAASVNSSGHEAPAQHSLCSEVPEGARPLIGAALGVQEGGRLRVAGVFVGTSTTQEGGLYGVYVRVSQYNHWIRMTIQQHHCEHPELPALVELVEPSIRYEHHSTIQLKCALKYYRLEGEEKYTCDADGVWRSGTGHSTWPKCVPVCGITDMAPYSSGRILGGQVARLGMLPWHLLMKEPNRAGATLLSDRWALTAASVVAGHQHRNLTLYGGVVDSLDRTPVVMVSEKILIHPGFHESASGAERTNYDSDIALIKLSSRVRLSPTLLPVCLPERAEGPALGGRMGTVSGFGTWKRGLKSRKLRHAAIQEYSEERCRDTPLHGLLNQPVPFTPNMFCAGLEGVDSCLGDGGGALVQPAVGVGLGEVYRVKGIVSWGSVCGSKTYYTKVQNYLEWIRETMERDT